MGKVYGIDLGTTYSVIATLDENGTPQVIDNNYDSIPLLASAVYFQEGGAPVVGKEAKNQAEIDPNRVVQYVKREIGKPDAQIREFDGVKYDPVTISSLILKRMKEYVEEQEGGEVKDVVITCPAYFGIKERDATRDAGAIAGLNVLNIINEPTAAALNYCCREFKENRKIMVYDLGGGTFDVTLFNFSVDENGKASIDVLKTGGNDRLGGIDWDDRLFGYISELYTNEHGLSQSDMDGELRQKIRNQVEDVKKSLSGIASKSFSIHYSGDSTRLEVTREKFEELTKDLVEQTMDFVRNLLTSAAISANDVDVVLLVGGSTKMPMIKTAVENLFPGKVRVEQPDLAVAKGAALAAAVEWNERLLAFIEQKESSNNESPIADIIDETITKEEAKKLMLNVPQVISGENAINDILTRSFGPAVFTDKGYMIDNLLFLGDSSPSESSQTYGTMSENQRVVELYIFENVCEDRINKYVTPCLDENDKEQYTDPLLKVNSLGKVSMELPPNTPKNSPIEVTFQCGAFGLKVIARNPATGESVDAVIISEGKKTQEEIDEAKKRFAAIRTSGQI